MYPVYLSAMVTVLAMAAQQHSNCKFKSRRRDAICAGEIVVGGKKVLFMDEISTGLDSATTYLITKCLSNFCHLLDATLLVALLQPAPETYNLFDDVMLLSQGSIVFHGPREEVSTTAAVTP